MLAGVEHPLLPLGSVGVVLDGRQGGKALGGSQGVLKLWLKGGG